jgi:hypothetical protein
MSGVSRRGEDASGHSEGDGGAGSTQRFTTGIVAFRNADERTSSRTYSRSSTSAASAAFELKKLLRYLTHTPTVLVCCGAV